MVDDDAVYALAGESTIGESGVAQLLFQGERQCTFPEMFEGNVPNPKYHERAAVSFDRDAAYYCPKPFGKLFRAVGYLYWLYTRVFNRLHYWGFLDCEEGKSRLAAARHLRNWHLAFWKNRHCSGYTFKKCMRKDDFSLLDVAEPHCHTCHLPQAA